jgi:hypothetical protein
MLQAAGIMNGSLAGKLEGRQEVAGDAALHGQ